jgi:hypothetical protein
MLVFVFFVSFVIKSARLADFEVRSGKRCCQSWNFLLRVSLVDWLPALVGLTARIAVPGEGMRGVQMDFVNCRPAFRFAHSSLVLLATLFGAKCCACFAQQPVIGSAPVQSAGQQVLEAGDLYLPNSHVYVFVGKTGLGHEHGVIGQLKQGHINLAAPAGAAQREAGSLVFDMGSFTADTPEARKFVGLEQSGESKTQQHMVDSNMHGSGVLDVAKFPTATFTIKQIKKMDQPSQRKLPQVELNGDFTLHGVTRPIQVVAEVDDKDQWTHLMGGFKMLQTQFGITPFKKALGAVGVTDQLTVWGDLWIAKQRLTATPAATAK